MGYRAIGTEMKKRKEEVERSIVGKAAEITMPVEKKRFHISWFRPSLEGRLLTIDLSVVPVRFPTTPQPSARSRLLDPFKRRQRRCYRAA
jgi:hypothetical protein